MGVESDQLVYDYLSRVGDLAQTALPAAQRMRLVAQLRNDIDRERGGSDSAATVRQILGRLGSPDEVVEAAAGALSRTPRPAPRTPRPAPEVPKQRTTDPDDDPATGDPGTGAGEPDWWRLGVRRRPAAGEELAGLPGMTGGVLIPLDPPEDDDEDGPGAAREAAAEDEQEDGQQDGPRRRRAPRLWPYRRRAADAAEPARGRLLGASPLLALAALLLVAGAVIGSWIPLGIGWLIAYASPRLTREQAKFAVLGIPGLVAVGLLIWLWGRTDGRWGEPIAQGHMGQALTGAFPAVVRVAAVASALYLVWRSRRLQG